MVKEKAYLSAALRARFDANAIFLRLPFERIDAATDAEMQSAVVKHRVSGDLFEALQRINQDELTEAGPAGCDSGKCLQPFAKPGGHQTTKPGFGFQHICRNPSHR